MFRYKLKRFYGLVVDRHHWWWSGGGLVVDRQAVLFC